MKKFLLLAFNIFVSLGFPSIATSDEIVIGQTVNRSGEFKKYANAICVGIEAALRYTNEQGGVNGKRLRLETHNDKGHPTLAQSFVADMENRGINLFIGSMGTRSVLKLLPKVKSGSISMLFPWSGDPALHNATTRHLINGPGLLQPQIEELVRYACDELHLKKIALLHADDTFSTAGAKQLQTALSHRNIKPTKVANYSRHTLRFRQPCEELLKTDPKVVACVGTSMPLVKLVKTFFTNGHYNTIFLGIDSTFMTSDILGDMGATVYYTSMVPNPKTSNLPIAQEFITSLKIYNPAAIPNVLSFTYYLFTKLLIEALQKTTTRDELIAYFEQLKNYSVGGFSVNFDAASRHLTGNTIHLIKD